MSVQSCCLITKSKVSFSHVAKASRGIDASQVTHLVTDAHVSRLPDCIQHGKLSTTSINSGRHKTELQSWNGHGRNLENAPSQLVVPVWNSLPPAVSNIDSHPAFRRAL